MDSTAITADMRFHHVGIACREIGRDRGFYTAMGFRPDGLVFEDTNQGIRGQFLQLDTYRVELLEPLVAGQASPLDPYLSRGIKLYHQAFATQDLLLASDRLTAAGAVVTVPPVPAVAFEGRLISFLMLPNMHLVELVQER